MFVKRDDGLGTVLLPFDIGALAGAVILSAALPARGLWAAAAFVLWWLCCFLGLLAVFVIFLWLMSLTVNTKKPVPEDDHPFYRAVVVYVIGLLCRLGRVRITFRGADRLPEGRFLVVSNHRSQYDPIVTVWALRKRPTAFITKPENHRIPIAGPMIYKANYLPIDRSDPRQAMKTINAAAALLKNDVVSVGVYPEGTRGPGGEMLPFHNGVFKIAQKANVPIVVVSVAGTEKIHKNLPLRGTDVTLCLCDVIRPEEPDMSTARIGERVRHSLAAALEETRC